MKTFPGCPPLILLFIALATLLMQAQNPSAPALSADEEIVRELTERYYLDFEKRDFEDQHAMWSPRSTDDSSKRRSYETWVKLKVEKFVVENVRVTGDQARVRITVHLSGVSAKTGKPLGGWLNRDVRLTHKLVKEDRNWLLLWQVPTDEDIVESVLAARNDKERQAIMAADKVVADREFISNYASAALGGPVKISPESSVDNLKFALKLAEQANAEEEIGLINGYLGNSYMLLGDHALALIADMKARDISEKRGDARDVANAFNSIGVDYDNLGDPERALESYQKSVATVVPGIVPDSRFTRLSGNIAGTLLQMGRYDEAKSAYEKLLSFSTEKNLRHDIAAAYQGLCTVYSELGDLQRALGYCTKAEKECEEEKDPGQMAGIASKSAEVNYLLGNFDEALRLSGRIADLSNSLGYKDDASWRADMVAAQTLIALGKPDEAKGRLESAIRTVETFGDRALGGEDTRQRFFASKTQPYRVMIELLLSEGRVEEAFSYAERARARVLLSVVQGGRASVTKSMSPKEVADERDLVDRIADLNRSITALKQNTGTDPGRVAELEKELKAARADHENFRLRLYSAHPELMVQRGEMKAVTLAETRQLLPDSGSAIAEFVVSEKKAFVFVFTLDRAQKATIKPIILNIDGKTLADKIEAYRSSVAAGDLGFQQKGAELYDLLIKPVEPQLRGIRDLAIVPDGPLWGMPFQALNDRTGKYLVERMAISYAPSVTVLAAMRKKGSAADTAGRRELIAFGNPIPGRETSERVQKVFMGEKLEPLPEAERLVNELRRMYGPAKSEVYTGLGASEEVAKSQMPKFKIIQFATHGILDDANPLYSHLVLSHSSGDQNEDGLLEAWEMKDLDLGADMVILSACDTARGRFSSGEGVIGMTWAMFIAGASATVASQWSVESSSTTELMLEFHRQLLGKLRTSKAEALRQAELKVMRMPRYRHPSYWAGFVVVGNGN